MTASKRHPSVEEWAQWVEEAVDSARAQSLEEHLARCEDCQRLTEALRQLARGRGDETWKEPPEEILNQVSRMPDEVQAPDLGEVVDEAQWEPADVRGSGAGLAGEGRMLARSFPDADLSILVTPPEGDGDLSVEGRIWLRRPDNRPIQVVLAQEDHVLAQVETTDGGRFTMHEMVGGAWQLEFHLPSGGTIVLREPIS